MKVHLQAQDERGLVSIQRLSIVDAFSETTKYYHYASVDPNTVGDYHGCGLLIRIAAPPLSTPIAPGFRPTAAVSSPA